VFDGKTPLENARFMIKAVKNAAKTSNLKLNMVKTTRSDTGGNDEQ
jgi:hypothetical protein